MLISCLVACGKPINVKPLKSQQLSKPVYVVIDYVHFRDDIGKLLNYDVHLNRKRITSLKTQVSNLLKSNGFDDHHYVFMSSGLDFNPENNYQLVNNRVEQEGTINPPFIIIEPNISESLKSQLVYGFKFAQDVFDYKAYKNINDFGRFPVITLKELSTTGSSKFSEDSLIFYVRTIVPEISMGKTLLVGSFTGALTLAATGGAGFLVTTPNGTPVTNLALVDNKNGELLWRETIKKNMATISKKQLLKSLSSFPVLKKKP